MMIATKYEQLNSHFISLFEHNSEITTSIGISICNGETFTASQILRYADEALYNVKRLGKDTFSVYGAK